MQGNHDDIRVYNYARTNADIAADYLLTASGLGPSGQNNIPCQYLQFEGNVQPHNLVIGTSPPGQVTNDAMGQGCRIVTAGTVMEWASNSPNQPAFPSTVLRAGARYRSTTVFRLRAEAPVSRTD